MKNYTSIGKIFNQNIPRYNVHSNTGGHFDITAATRLLRVALIDHKKISEKEIIRCFAFSKMTVLDELDDRQSYFKMHFTEYLEFLCRVAYHLYHKEFKNATGISGMLEKLLEHLCNEYHVQFVS